MKEPYFAPKRSSSLIFAPTELPKAILDIANAYSAVTDRCRRDHLFLCDKLCQSIAVFDEFIEYRHFTFIKIGNQLNDLAVGILKFGGYYCFGLCGIYGKGNEGRGVRSYP